MLLNRNYCFTIIAVLLYCSFALANDTKPNRLCLTIVNLSQKDKIVFSSEVNAGTYFVYKYTHSLQKLPIEEQFRVRLDRTFELVDSKVLSLAAAGVFPAPQETLRKEKNYLHVRTSRIFQTVQIRAAYYYDQYLILNNDTFNISTKVTPGDLLELKLSDGAMNE